MVWIALFTALVVVLPGCSGPEKTCKKSAESYFSLLSSSSWGGMFKMLTEQNRKSLDNNPKKFAYLMEEVFEYKGSKNFRLKKLTPYAGRDSCSVQVVYDYSVKLRGKEEQAYDGVEETWLFQKSPKDGLWYYHIPEGKQLGGF
jgi:hypothetical protein